MPPSPLKASFVQSSRPTGLERLNVVRSSRPQLRKWPRKENSMHIFKRLEQYISAVFKLGRIERIAKRADRAAAKNAARTEDIFKGMTHKLEEMTDKLIDTTREQNAKLEDHKVWIEGRLSEQALHINKLSHRLDQLPRDRRSSGSKIDQPAPPSQSEKLPEGLQFFLDTFYNRLENRFRGSREEILNRLRIYHTDVTDAVDRTGGKPVLDLACGRGEWLSLMRELGIEAIGVDINEVQIASAQDDNLKAYHKDAFEALSEAENESLSVISAHHFIEHISFPQLSWLVMEAQRALAPGGLLLLETPNPANLIVGSTNFYIDPTHKHPLPSQLLEILFETVGFGSVEIRYLHPGDNLAEMLSQPNINPEIAQLLFGPQDLAVLGQKPGRKA